MKWSSPGSGQGGIYDIELCFLKAFEDVLGEGEDRMMMR